MQSSPASAEATSVSILSPVFASPGAAAEVEVVVDKFPQSQVLAACPSKTIYVITCT